MTTQESTASRAVERAIAPLAGLLCVGTFLAIATPLDPRLLPDYGDLWRWSTSISADGDLTMSEVFSEYQLIGHTSILTIPMTHLAATGIGFRFMWLLGVLAYGLSVAAATRPLAMVLGPGRGPVARGVTLVGTVVGSLTIVRFDVSFSMVNTLLAFEQIYYLVLYLAFWFAASVAYDCERASHSSPRVARDGIEAGANSGHGFGPSAWQQVALVAALVFGDAPASVLVLAMLAGGVYSVVWRAGPYAVGLRRVGVLAVLAVAGRWLLGFVFDARSSRGEGIHLSELGGAVIDSFKLIGSSIVRLPFDPEGRIFPAAAVGLGLSLSILWLAALLIDARSTYLSKVVERKALLFLFALATMMVAVLSIGITRDLGTTYHLSRFVRTTAFSALLTVYAISRIWPLRPSLRMVPDRRTVLLTFVFLIFAWRASSIDDLVWRMRHESDRQATQIAMICEQNGDVEAWGRVWPAFNDDRIAKLQAEPLFPDRSC